jgi:hypothetical protein
LPGYVNVDFAPSESPDVVCDLGVDTWPWPDSSVEGAVASHILEHLPGEQFFHFLRELYRVSKPGAVTEITLPHPSHDIYLNDPTHVRSVMPGTMVMFDRAYLAALAKRGDFLTSFAERCGVDFKFGPRVHYTFDPAIDKNDPNLEHRMKHERNVIFMWYSTLTAVK